MKKVLVHAYTNYNLGDDLFIKVLCNRYSRTRFFLHAPKKYKRVFREVENLKVIPSDTYVYRGINFLLRKISNVFRFGDIKSIRDVISNRYDAAVNIGGSIYMQDEHWREKLERKKRMKIKNKPFFVIGANFGPYHDEEYYSVYKELFKDYTDICFRDTYSFNLFKKLNNVRLADDVIFQLKHDQRNIIEKSNDIVISVIKPSIRKDLVEFDNIYYEKIKDIAVYFIEREYNITLVSFCVNEGDKEAISSIKNIIPKKYLTKVNEHIYIDNMEETLNVIAKSKFVIGTRFHAMILGWVYNKPVFPIAYSEKMINVMNDIHFEGSYTDFNNLKHLKVEDVFNSMLTDPIDVSSQIKNAEKQFEKLDEYL